MTMAARSAKMSAVLFFFSCGYRLLLFFTLCCIEDGLFFFLLAVEVARLDNGVA